MTGGGRYLDLEVAAAGNTEMLITAGSLIAFETLYARTLIVCVPGVAFHFCTNVKVVWPCGIGGTSERTVVPFTANSTRATPLVSVAVD